VEIEIDEGAGDVFDRGEAAIEIARREGSSTKSVATLVPAISG
jgi:hypothetical protein